MSRGRVLCLRGAFWLLSLHTAGMLLRDRSYTYLSLMNSKPPLYVTDMACIAILAMLLCGRWFRKPNIPGTSFTFMLLLAFLFSLGRGLLLYPLAEVMRD